MSNTPGPSRFTFDEVTGALLVSSSGGGGGAVNITQILGNPVALSNPLPVELSDGTNPFGTAGNPLSVNVISGGGSNASVSATGAAVPASATMVAGSDGTNLRALKLDTDGTANEDLTKIGGTAIAVAAAGIQKVGLADGTGNALTSTGNALDVNIKTGLSNPLPVSQGTPAANTAGWPITSGGTVESTAAWTSATALNTALQVNTAGYATVVVTLNITGTITGGVVTFEASDTTGFTSAYSINGLKSNQGINTGPGVASIAFAGLVNTAVIFCVAGLASFRVRLSTIVVNTGTLNVGIAAAAMPNQILGIVRADGSLLSVQSSVAGTSLADNLASTNIFTNANSGSLPLSVADSVYGGAFSGTPNAALQGWSKLRTPTIFKTALATASGNTAVWTPATGNKFRLMRFMVQVTGNATTGAGVVVTVSFQDSASGMNIAMDIFVPAAAFNTSDDFISPWVDLGNGFLSAAANNVLNVNLSAALTAGNVRVTVCGTEE